MSTKLVLNLQAAARAAVVVARAAVVVAADVVVAEVAVAAVVVAAAGHAGKILIRSAFLDHNKCSRTMRCGC
jgi:hypothetical protein